MDIEVYLHPIQPDPIIVKNANSMRNAMEVVLHFAYVNYPGWFIDAPEIMSCSYHDKFLVAGFPLVSEVTQWQ